MYKLIAIDLDGTLLNSYGEISKKSKEAIKKAIEKGVHVVLASGRPISSVKSFANEIEANNYIICGNGSALYDMKNEQMVYTNPLNTQKALEIIKVCEDNSLYYSIYTGNMTIAKALNYNILSYNYENQNKPEDKKTNIKIMDNIYNYIQENKNMPVFKMTICDEDEVIFSRILAKLKEIKNVDVLDVEHMSRKVIKYGTQDVTLGYYYTEITNNNVNKWNAIEELAKRLQIKNEEIMTIGDNINDKEMTVNSGLGVIMGNSAPYMKEVADAIVSDNNNDGVAEAIEKYVLNY